ncbi:arylesterase [Psychrobacter frigidicola]|uniref:arylesterase n=1 Tax=Psychrobacter frigidicola TaxID=45611 RepID=UPI00191958A0|nr:arylesterase [Psychrobacter frigidicola]
MLDVSLGFSKRYSVTVVLLTALLMLVLAISGCQKASETDTVNDEAVANTQTTAESPIQTDQQLTQPANSQSLTILALGDSLTEGLGVANDANYPAQLEASLQEMGYKNVKVINSGLSGETSTGLVNRLDWVAQTKPDITILTIGANDAIRGIDVATVEDNIRTAVKHLQDNGSQVILGGMQIYDNLGNDYVQSFAAMYPRIAKDMNVTLIPFFLDGVAADANLNQADAIHPTSEGYTIIVNDNILPILKPEIEQMLANKSAVLAPENMPEETPLVETSQ